MERDVKIINKLGLHARAASLFVKEAEKYNVKVEMEKDGIRINAKSIMGILMLAAPVGSIIKIITTGEDDELCINALTELVNNKFNESE